MYIDYLDDRAPFAAHSEKVIELCERKEVVGVLTASSATDIYYVMRKVLGREKTLEHLKFLFSIPDVADVGRNDLLRAMELDIKDFEDALASACARRIRADYVLTRDIEDFRNSAVAPITPGDFLTRFFPCAL
ncbi:MAG: PIN domain-containing protein [Synergistaceae bacterium]|jgi:predicted nucleic acid-binding protein|nr:PIN domain-containing protein [Synergistaceae bacterium]